MAARSPIPKAPKRSAARAGHAGIRPEDASPKAGSAWRTLLSMGTSAWGGILVFGVATGLFAALVIQPSIVLYTQQPAFLWERRFFASFLNRPGGLLEWLAAGLLQWHASDLVGSVVCMVLSVLLVTALRGYLITLASRPPAPPFYFVPAAAVLALLGRYDFPWVDITLGFVLSIGAAWLYGQAWVRVAWLRLGLFTGLVVGVYWLAAGQVLMFGACVAVLELARARNVVMAMAALTFAATLPWAATGLYAIHLEDAYWLKLAWAPRRIIVYPALAIFLLPILAAAAFAWSQRGGRTPPPEAGTPLVPKSPASTRKPSTWHTRLWRLLGAAAWHPALPLGLAVGGLLCLWRADDRLLLDMGLRCQQQQWNEVLRLARAARAYTAASVADTHRALAQQGQLLEILFSFPQTRAYPLWLTLHDHFDTDRCMKASDMLFELGQVNKAERMAGEALELNGYLPHVLERLALINVLKSETASARIFLKVMAQSPLGAAAARRYLQALDAEASLASNPELTRVRSLQLTEDFYGDHQVEEMMQQSLDQNPRNLLALQYLFAFYLLELKLEEIENNLGRLSRAGWEAIPVHCEEALLILQKLSRGRPLRLDGLSIRPATVARYEEFHRRFMSYGGQMELARAQMLAQFGDTYWFYYMFGATGSAGTAVNRGVRP